MERISIDKIINHAARRCGVTTPTLEPEQLEMAKQNLKYTLLDLNNRGVPIYLVENTLMGFQPQKWEYTLPRDVYDITNINWRTVSFLPAIITGGVDPELLADQNWFTWATTTTNFTLTMDQFYFYDGYSINFKGNQVVGFVIESTEDDINWTVIDTYPTAAYTDGQWIWSDIETPVNGIRMRLRVTSSNEISLRFFQATQPVSSFERVVTRMNRADFFSQPQKGIIGSPWNWYFQKIIDPILMMWQSPTPHNVFTWLYNIYYIKAPNDDKMNLPAEIQVPMWYVDAITWGLAAKMIYELPQANKDMIGALESKAMQAVNQAEASNADLAPINLIGSVLGSYNRY